MSMQKFIDDAANLPQRWRAHAITLAEYAKHLSGSDPIWENEQWVFRPKNFVTFRVQHKRKTGLTLYLRGYASEHASLNGKRTVVNSVPGYSKIIIDRFDQVPEAMFAVCRAHQLYERGSRRRRRGFVLAEAEF